MSGRSFFALIPAHRSATVYARGATRVIGGALVALTATTTSIWPVHAQVADTALAATFVHALPVGVQAKRFDPGAKLHWLQPAQDRPDVPLLQATTPESRWPNSQPLGAPAARPATWWAPVASALLPGAGQALLRQQRSLAYVVAEAFMVIQAARIQTDFGDARKRYRNIAADVARLPFGTDRPVGPWEYYETLANPSVTASGSYDLAIGGKFTPESDEATYNGRQWLLARELYWSSPVARPPENSPEYQKALSFYQARAVQGSFRWSWRDNQNAKELYVQTIGEANHSRQQGVSMVGLVAANHLLSLVDAYITVRLRRYGGAGIVNASINSELRPTGVPGQNSIAAALKVSVPIPGSRHRE